MEPERLAQTLAAIDARNADDPHRLVVRGIERPKELAHAEMMTEWIERLAPEMLGETASPALQIAARAHHLRRWAIPRSDYPQGREGYLRWRTAQKAMHAEECAKILEAGGHESALGERVGAILQKKNLRRDAEVQVFEDALCLVFLETQLADLSAKTERPKMVTVAAKTIAKMSPRAVELALELPLTTEQRELLGEAAASLRN